MSSAVWNQSTRSRVTAIYSEDHRQEVLDRLGRDAYSILLCILLGTPVGWFLSLRGPWLVLFVVVAAWVTARSLKRMTAAIINGTANAFLRLVWPSGNSTPYENTYSQEQAMVARGDIDGAMVRYGAAMRLHPSDPELRFRAAEVLFKSEKPARAVSFFIEGRHLAGDNRSKELYATQRLIDLYLGPLGNPVGALVELTRLVDRFPGTREADAAANLLAKLKQQESPQT